MLGRIEDTISFKQIGENEYMRKINAREIGIVELQEDIEAIVDEFVDNPGCTDIYYIIDDGEVKGVLYPYGFTPEAGDVERFITKVNDDYSIELPITLTSRLGWKEGDDITMEVKDGAIVVRKANEKAD
jgi:hypothetical protein